MESAHEDLALSKVRLLAMDVDGVLTDGRLGLHSTAGEQKTFHVTDGLGLVVLRQQGVAIAWMSGRSNPIVERRAAELRIDHVIQGVRDKSAALLQLQRDLGVDKSETAYIGDDWNDLLAFGSAGVKIAVANATAEVMNLSDWITERSGGHGAVREVCDRLLDARGSREQALDTYLRSLQDPETTRTAGQ